MKSVAQISKRKVFAYFMISISAIFYTIALQMFLQVGKTFASGLSAFAALPTFVWSGLNFYFSLFYIAANIPLIIIFWKKNKRRFMYRTLYFLIAQSFFGAFFLINSVSDWAISITADELPRDERWPIFVLAIIGSVIAGFAIVISFKWGGSTGGTDIIIYYFSTKTKKSIGSMMFFVSTIIVMFSFSVTIAFNQEIRQYWLVTLFSTFIYIFISSSIVHVVYPKYRLVELSIISTKSSDIENMFRRSKFNHSWRTQDFISSFTGKNKNVINTTIFLLEKRDVIFKIKKIDPQCWISVRMLHSVEGNVDQSWLD